MAGGHACGGLPRYKCFDAFWYGAHGNVHGVRRYFGDGEDRHARHDDQHRWQARSCHGVYGYFYRAGIWRVSGALADTHRRKRNQPHRRDRDREQFRERRYADGVGPPGWHYRVVQQFYRRPHAERDRDNCELPDGPAKCGVQQRLQRQPHGCLCGHSRRRNAFAQHCVRRHRWHVHQRAPDQHGQPDGGQRRTVDGECHNVPRDCDQRLLHIHLIRFSVFGRGWEHPVQRPDQHAAARHRRPVLQR